MRRLLLSCLLSCFALGAYATPSKISLFDSKYGIQNVSIEKINGVVNKHFDLSQYRNAKVQVIYNKNQSIRYLLVFLFAQNSHSVKVAKVDIDSQYHVLSIQQNYHITADDSAQQRGLQVKDAMCPDPSVEVIAFAPNYMDLEQQVTIDVADAADSHHLKTVRLLKDAATRDAYLNYMTCPNLKGNFYDGDANPSLIITNDGYITSDDFKQILANKFRFKVTNIWLACEAFNDPMKSTMIDTVQAQKYAAGINDLLIGPSDYAAACAMKEAFNGKPMETAFWDCYKKLDTPKDHWGYGGKGSDYFGV